MADWNTAYNWMMDNEDHPRACKQVPDAGAPGSLGAMLRDQRDQFGGMARAVCRHRSHVRKMSAGPRSSSFITIASGITGSRRSRRTRCASGYLIMR